MSDQKLSETEGREAAQRRILTQHSVVRLTVLRAADPCPAFHPGDVFYVRQHVLDTEISTIRNFCYNALFDLYKVYMRVRRGPVGGKETFLCRDKGMVEFEVERLPDEKALIGRAEAVGPGCGSGSTRDGFLTA